MSGLQKDGPELSSNSGPENETSTNMLPTHILTRAGSIDNRNVGNWPSYPPRPPFSP